MKRAREQNKFNAKKTKYIDIIYSQFDSDSDSEDDPEWLPPTNLARILVLSRIQKLFPPLVLSRIQNQN